jgi:hypothetical protein
VMSDSIDECQCCTACGGYGIPCDEVSSGGYCERICCCGLYDSDTSDPIPEGSLDEDE